MAEIPTSGGAGHILKILAQSFGLGVQKCKDELHDDKTYAAIIDFLKGDERVPKLVFFYQTRDTYNPDTHELEFEAPDNATPQLFLTTGELERQKATGVFFIRTKGAKEVSDQKPEEAS